MDKKVELSKEIKEMAVLTKAMGHPVRLYILQKLSKMNACCYSGDLVEELPAFERTKICRTYSGRNRTSLHKILPEPQKLGKDKKNVSSII